MERLIFHIDVNSAFLSWESARRVKQGLQDLRDIPACIGGNPKKRTGIVVAKSIPAKKYGIQTGEPMAMAIRKCPELVIVKSDFELYIKCSRAFKEICASYAPVMESFSIDEVFLDMTGTSLIYPDPIATAYEIKDKIYKELGFTVNVGISTNKLLAKMASDFEKPDKVHTLFPDEIPAKMWPLPVRELLFLGKVSEKKLVEAGIRTIGDLAHEREERIQALLGEKAGHQLYGYARGIDDSPVRAQPEEARDSKYFIDENGKPYKLFQIIMTGITYAVIVEICFLIMAVMEKYFITCLSSSVLKLLCAIDAGIFAHIVIILLIIIKNIYYIFWKPEDGD